MKRGVFCLLTLLLLLTACRTHADIGVIGGADGPTRIFVAKNGDAAAGSVEDMGYEVTALSAADLAFYTDFLNRPDVYGFLLSNYDDVRDADLVQVFYTGAGAASPAPDWMYAVYNPEGFGDVTWVTAESLNAVLLNRTGYSLQDFLEYGSGFADELDEDSDFIHVAGDTNYIRVEAAGGERYGDGSVRVESTDREGENPNTFSTVFLEQEDGDPLIYCNTVTGGLLAWALEQQETGSGFVDFTAERPPFDGYGWFAEEPAEETLPVTLSLVSETENSNSTDMDWMSSRWGEWLEDEHFTAEHGADTPGQLSDTDEFYRYRIEDGQHNGQGVSIWFDATAVLSADFSGYLFENEDTPGHAQSTAWARLLNGNLIVSNFNSLGAEDNDGRNAYLTAVDTGEGRLVWRSDPLVCNSRNFEAVGIFDGAWIQEGVLLCGYGHAGENCYIYQLGVDSGKVLDRTPVDSPPEWLVCANGNLYVHCAQQDYVFAVSFG